MTRPGYVQLQDVLLDDEFPELDLALRRGRHVDRDDAAWYALLTDAQDHLETFYRRYGAELIHKTDGYFYLLPTGDKLSRRTLGAGEMLVGQALALLYLDPTAVERGGQVSVEDVVAQLVAVLGSDALIAEFNPKRKRHDERIAQKNVRARIGDAVRKLAVLGFVDALDGDKLRLRASLLRFAEPVRGLSAPAEALAKLVAQGEVALADERADGDGGDGDERADDDGDDGAGARDDDDGDRDADHDDDAGDEPADDRDLDATDDRDPADDDGDEADEGAPAAPAVVPPVAPRPRVIERTLDDLDDDGLDRDELDDDGDGFGG